MRPRWRDMRAAWDTGSQEAVEAVMITPSTPGPALKASPAATASSPPARLAMGLDIDFLSKIEKILTAPNGEQWVMLLLGLLTMIKR